MKLRTAAAWSAVLLGLLSACDNAVTPEEYLGRAEVHSEAGDLRAAVIELRNAAQADRENATAYLRLGRAYVDLGDSLAGERALQRASDLDVDYAEIVEPLGRAWLQQGKLYQILYGVLPEHAAVQADRVSILNTRGEAFLALSDGTDATLSYRRALELDSRSIQAAVGLVRTAMLEGDTEKAESALRAAATIDASHPGFFAARGDLAVSMQDFAAAEDAYQTLVDLQPENLPNRVALARAQLANGKPDVAIPHLDAVLSEQPASLDILYLRAVSAYQTGDYEGALQHSDTVLRAEPRHLESVLISGAAQFALGRWEEAYRQLDRFLFERPDHIGAVKLRAAAALHTDRSDETLISLENALARDAQDVQLLALIGAASLSSGDPEAAVAHFGRLVALQPGQANLRQQLGLAELARSNRAAGLAALEQALAIDGNLTAAVRVLAIERLRDGVFDKALSLAQRLQELEPGSADGYSLAALAHLGEEEFVLAETSFRRALEVSPGNTNASISLARLLVQLNRSNEAQSVLDSALEHDPVQLVVLLALADLAGLRGDEEQRLSLLQRASAEHPAVAAPHILLARQHLLDVDMEKVSAVTESALLRNSDNIDLLRLNAQALIELGLLEEAVRPLERLVSADPQASDARRLLIRRYLEADRPFKAEDQLEALLRLEPSDIEAKALLLRLLIATQTSLARADSLLRDLQREAPDLSDLGRLESSLALLEGRTDDAVRLLSEEIELRPTSEATLRLAQAQIQAGETDAGRATLEHWLEAHPDDVAARLALANVHLVSESMEAARAQYEQAIISSENQPDLAENQIAALNNLAWIHLEQGNPEESLPLAERAYALAPDDARVMDTYAMALFAVERPLEAGELLRRALDILPDNPDIAEHLRVVEGQIALTE